MIRVRDVLCALVVAVVVVVTAVDGFAAGPACPDEGCVARKARSLGEEGHSNEAIALLKEGVGRFPDSGVLRVMLAAEYGRSGNHAWAVRTLSSWLEDHPDDCEARTFLAWSYVEMGDTAEPAELLGGGVCDGPGPFAFRADLIRAVLGESTGDEEAASHALGSARNRPVAFAADIAALAAVGRLIEPYRLEDVSWGVEAAAGFTTNALLGSPNDPSADPSGGSESALIQTNAWVRVAPQVAGILRPLAEFQARALHFFESTARDLSYLNLTGRAGLLLDWEDARLLLAYRPDYLLLGRGDSFDSGPIWYAGGHRAEVEVEVVPWVFGFAGGGRRVFREMGRSRWEADGGIAGQGTVAGALRVVAAVSGRRHWADERGYDLTGLTALLNLGASLPRGWSVQAIASVFVDWYTGSSGFEPFGLTSGESRRDVFVKASATAWAAPLWGVRIGAGYEYSRRFSTASQYSQSDHRALLKMKWSGSLDFGGPAGTSDVPSAEIQWGLTGGGTTGDRIQDLLRQDDQVQGVCGCGS